jgi:hypothetical protein
MIDRVWLQRPAYGPGLCPLRFPLNPNYPYDAYYYDAYDDADAYSSLSFRIRASRLWT